MRLPFSGRYEKLETMNRILTDAARKRAERIEELERRVAQLEQQLEPARKAIERVKELEIVAAERAHLLNEKDKSLRLYAKLSPTTIFGFKSWNAPWPKLARSDVPMGFWRRI
jgi:malonyl CoA-acyl carrier protein transacylase